MALPSVVSATSVPVLSSGQVSAMVQQSTLPFTMQHQQQTNWCWAALTASVSLYYNASSTWTQCSLANTELNQTTCCADGSSAECNMGWYPNLSLQTTGNLASWQQTTVPFSTVQAQVNAKRPLGCRIGWSGGGGHAVALYGYNATVQPSTVAVADPWYGDSVYTYEAFSSAYQGSGTWTYTFLTQP